ncbi:MAG TPA: helix-turn-helix domain-containing protein [Segetibacter sp.]|jgi:AraC-like DNA-binding protein
MFIDNIIPSSALAEYVRIYRIIDFFFADEPPLFPKLYTPRPEICLQFYPKEREKIQYQNEAEAKTGNEISITGQHTIVQNRFVPKSFLSLQVVFQPGALYRLTGVPAALFTDATIDAADVFSKDLGFVTEQLLEAVQYSQMIAIVEAFLIKIIKRVTTPCHTISKVANAMMFDTNEHTLDDFTKQAFICARQFDRKFYELVGINPKRFLKIIRFDRAFRLKNRFPKMDWLTIAIHCGYHDYQHLAKDYKEFTGLTPSTFFDFETKGPDRLVGVSEV